MINKLTKEDISMIIESLNYTKLKFEEYDKYPSYEFKQKKIKEVNNLILKIKQIRKE